MKRGIQLFAGLMSIWCTQALAQMPPPQGSYLQSCRDVRFDGVMLSAVCNAMQGSPQRTSLRADACRGPIENVNGNLVCGGGGGGGREPGYGRRDPDGGGYGPRYGRDEYRGGYERGYEREYGRGPGYGGYERERGGGYDYDRERRGPPGYGPPGGYGPPPGPPPQQARPDYAPGGGGLPAGSWAASCVRPQMQGTTLVAACRDIQGALRNSSIDVRSCKSVANQNGRLVCG